MKWHVPIVAALTCFSAWQAIALSSAWAQYSAAQFNPNRPTARQFTWPPAHRVARHQPTPAAETPPTGPTGSTNPEVNAQPTEEPLPLGDYVPHEGNEFTYDEGAYMEGYALEGSYSDGYCEDGYCGEMGCCDACGNSGGNCHCRTDWFSRVLGGICPPGKFYVTADYLYVRSTFSEAVSFLDQNDDVQNLGVDTFHELEFDYESSYRVGGGYRTCDCCEQIRFMFTRLGSHAADVAPFGSFVPYEVSAPPGGETFIEGDFDLRSYDLEYAKTISLGGSCCGCAGACGDPCGCGDVCGGGCCPLWEITWSGGLRFADVETSREFTAVDANDIVTTDAIGVMEFEGGGPRFGLEGRRYFGKGGWFSAYLKGDVSLLLGRIDLLAERTVEGGSVPDLLNIQTQRHRQLIPVTEIEAGLAGQVTRNSALSAGYLFHAWHDLGFRDTFNFPVFLETSYDDANILGFDGLFARLEVSF